MIQNQKNVGIKGHIKVTIGEDLARLNPVALEVGIRKTTKRLEDVALEVEAVIDTPGQGDRAAKVHHTTDHTSQNHTSGRGLRTGRGINALYQEIDIAGHTLGIVIDQDVPGQNHT